MKFRFETKLDIFMRVVSILGAMGKGVLQPLMIIVFSNIIDSFTISGKDLCA
jgi:hypothetical protein